MLSEVNRLITMPVRSDAKDNVERARVPGQFLQGQGDLISGVEFEIESESGFARSNGTWQFLALLAGFQHRQIRIEDVGALMRAGTVNQDLSRRLRSSHDKHGHQTLASELNEQTGSLHTLFTHSCQYLSGSRPATRAHPSGLLTIVHPDSAAASINLT